MWYELSNPEEVASPALLVYPERVKENIRRMITMAGGAEPLRPHVKTHKLAEVVRMQIAQGITKFKCATIAELEMVAACGAPDALLAYQPVGPNRARLAELMRRFPEMRIAAIADDAGALRELSREFAQAGMTLPVLLDIDCGMHRTGVAPGDAAVALYKRIAELPGLEPGGLHAYDGHIHDRDPNEREKRCTEAFQAVLELRDRLNKAGLPVPTVVAGGTPTFPMHARRPAVECSPGTCVFWDAGYGSKLPDLDFVPAAVLLSRVVSKPGAERLCLDLGHKAVAAESPPPRVQWFGLTDAKAATHSEEHLVLETPGAEAYEVGDCLYGIPWHICPTVALHSHAVVVENGRATARWKIAARDRMLTV